MSSAFGWRRQHGRAPTLVINNHPLRGIVVEGGQGELLGQVESTYIEDTTGEPIWAAVSNGEQTELVPLDTASYDGAVLRLRRDTGELDTHPTGSRPAVRADKHLFGRVPPHTGPI